MNIYLVSGWRRFRPRTLLIPQLLAGVLARHTLIPAFIQRRRLLPSGIMCLKSIQTHRGTILFLDYWA
jgi:hypothetical protein